MIGEFVFLQGHTCCAQVLQEGQLLGQEEQQRAALGVGTTGRTTHAMDVFLGIIRRIILDDPVHRGDVETSRSHIGTQQNAAGLLAELEERGGALLLLLLAVDIHHLDVDVIQQFRVELDGVTRREKHHDFLVLVLLQECVQQHEALGRRADHIALLKTLHSGQHGIVVHTGVDRVRLHRQTSQILDLAGLCRRKQNRLALSGQVLHDLMHIFLETLV
mmetsp:Transcript_33382/g.57175  ORF Transcript_33382/g.57175 Transcript_33382/m.57175 type:complete len:218 (+) Transcript_33382:455-1108(+)